MTSEEFVKRIHTAVYESAIGVSLTLLEHPPGRSPSPALVALSQWFRGLSPEDKRHVRMAIRFAVGNAVFGVLTVLDGERAIRVAEEECGSLELRYETSDRSVLLNDPEGKPLHDIFSQFLHRSDGTIDPLSGPH